MLLCGQNYINPIHFLLVFGINHQHKMSYNPFFPPKKYNYFLFFGSSKSLTWSPNKLKTSITETMTALGARATHGAF